MVRAISIIFISSVIAVAAQAQFLEFDSLTRLSARVNSDYEESLPMLAPEGRDLFFSRSMHPRNVGGQYSGSDAWLSRYDLTIADWALPDNKALRFNTKDNASVIGINKTGSTVYLLRTSAYKNVHGIYFIKKVGERWSEPELVSIPGIESAGFLGAFVSPDFDVIFLSMQGQGTRGEEDLYISLKSPAGLWSAPKNLGPTINSVKGEISPFLSADKKRLYFASNGLEGEGDFDIYYSDRLYESWETWSAPKNLGKPINSKGFDAYFGIYGDSLIYLSSNRGGKYSDIYRGKVRKRTQPLGPSRHFLTADEIVQIMPAKVSRNIVFEGVAKDLTAVQVELLYYLANKIRLKDEVKVELYIADDMWDPATKDRMERITKELNQAGLSIDRISQVAAKPTKTKTAHRNVIELRLYRDRD